MKKHIYRLPMHYELIVEEGHDQKYGKTFVIPAIHLVANTTKSRTDLRKGESVIVIISKKNKSKNILNIVKKERTKS